jgi:hypothetical protein
MDGQRLQYTNIQDQGISQNESTDSPLDCESRFDEHKTRWALLLRYLDANEKYFVKLGEEKSEFRFRIVGSTIVFAPSGSDYLDLQLEKFMPAVAFDKETRKQVSVRRRIVTHSETGEPIYPVASVAAWKFCADYIPEESWMSRSEWSAMLAELAPLVSAEKSIQEGERAFIIERNRLAEERARAAASPTSELAAGIAAGVAQALKSMGLGRGKP